MMLQRQKVGVDMAAANRPTTKVMTERFQSAI